MEAVVLKTRVGSVVSGLMHEKGWTVELNVRSPDQYICFGFRV